MTPSPDGPVAPPRFRSREFTRQIAEVIALGCTPLILGSITWALCAWQGVAPDPISGPAWFTILCFIIILTTLAAAIGYLALAVRVWRSSHLDPGERLAIWATQYFFISGYAAIILLP